VRALSTRSSLESTCPKPVQELYAMSPRRGSCGCASSGIGLLLDAVRIQMI
jgi:hypothetical protein